MTGECFFETKDKDFFLLVSDCKAPELYDNEVLNTQNFSVGTVLQFSCKTGYRVQGYQNYTCHPDGYWIGSRPFCHLLDCGDPPVVKYGTFRSSGPQNGLGSIVTYTCDRNRTLLGDAVVYCTENEIWSGYPPTCIGRFRNFSPFSHWIYWLFFYRVWTTRASKQGNCTRLRLQS